VIRDIIQSEAGNEVSVIDSGEETAKTVKKMLQELNIQNEGINQGRFQFYVSDIPLKFEQIAERFLEKSINDTKRIDFEDFLSDHNEKIRQILNLHC
jgi:glutamate racemase